MGNTRRVMRNLPILICIILLFNSCVNKTTQIQKIVGEAQGTTYAISYVSEKSVIQKSSIDSIFTEIDNAVSHYVKSSVVSKFNSNQMNFEEALKNHHFKNLIYLSYQWNVLSDGAFDISMGQLSNYWGFGAEKKQSISVIDSLAIDSLMQYCGMSRFFAMNNGAISYTSDSIRTKLDFNAIAQGYSVDVLSDYLLENNIENYIIEVGGEIIAGGNKGEGESWKVAIDKPLSDTETREFQTILPLNDKAMATSGNYRKFYMLDGKKYAHTLNPANGFPVEHNLLSATVFADNCSSADALATILMVLGVEKSKAFIANNKLPIDVYLIYENEKGELEVFSKLED